MIKKILLILKEHKGFTLIEVIAVIFVLSLVFGISFNYVNNLINNSKDRSYRIFENNVKKSANLYVLENSDTVAWKQQSANNSFACVSINELVNLGYLDVDKVKNMNGITSVILTKNSSGSIIKEELDTSNKCGDSIQKINVPTSKDICKDITYNKTSQVLANSSNSNYYIDESTNTGTNAGNYEVKVILSDTSHYMWKDNTITSKNVTCTIKKATPIFTFDSYGDVGTVGKVNTVTMRSDIAGTLSIKSSNPSYAVGEIIDGDSIAANVDKTFQTRVLSSRDTFTYITVALTPNDSNNYSNITETYILGKVELKKVNKPTASLCKNVTFNRQNQLLVDIPSSSAGYTFSNYLQKDAGTYTITARLRYGYQWKNNGTNTTGDVTFRCSIKPLTVKVTFKSNYSGGGSDQSQTFTYGVSNQSFSKSFSRTGYSLLGWSRNASSTTKEYATTNGVSDDWIFNNAPNVTLYAIWKANILSICFYPNSGTLKSGYSYDRTKCGGNGVLQTVGYDNSTIASYNMYNVDTLYSKVGYHGAADASAWRKDSANSTTYINQAKQDLRGFIASKDATLNLYANWSPKTVKVTFNCNNGTGGGNQTFTYDVSGQKFSKTCTRTGYTMSGWNENSSGTGTSYSTANEVKNDWINTNSPSKTLYAKWTAKTVKVTFDCNGGTGGGNQSFTYDVNNQKFSKTCTRTGYTMSGWNENSSGTGTSYSTANEVKNDWINTNSPSKKLYAKWTAKTVKVTFNCNGGSGGGNQTFTYDVSGQKFSKTCTRSGYTLSGWNENNGGTGTNYSIANSVGNDWINTNSPSKTLYAKWTAISVATYTVSYNANGGSGAPGSQTKTHNVALTLSSTKPTRTGYDFQGWGKTTSATSATYSAGGTYTANESATLYAVWKAKTVKVTFNCNGGTGGGNQTFTYGVSNQKFSKTCTRTGYTLSGWNENNGGTGTNYSIANSVGNDWINTNSPSKTLYAKWTAISVATYTVSYDANGGSGAPDSQTKTHGVNLTLSSTIPTKSGYTFQGWGTTNSATTASYSAGGTYTTDANAILYAVWSSSTKIYKVYYNGNGSTGQNYDNTSKCNSSGKCGLARYASGSSVSGSLFKHNRSWEYGKSYDLVYNQFYKTGYNFNGWSTSSNGTGTSYSQQQSVSNLSSTNGAEVTLYAKWSAKTIDVTFNCNGGTGGGNQTFTYGRSNQKFSKTCTRTGYDLSGWSKTSGGSKNYNVAASVSDNWINENSPSITLYAVWSIKTYTISFNANGGKNPPSNQTKTYGQDLTLSSTKPTRSGYTFNGWGTSASATSATYSAGGKYTSNSSDTLYAVWKAKCSKTNYTACPRIYLCRDGDTAYFNKNNSDVCTDNMDGAVPQDTEIYELGTIAKGYKVYIKGVGVRYICRGCLSYKSDTSDCVDSCKDL